MKKKILALTLATLMTGLLAACGGGASSSAAAPAAKSATDSTPASSVSAADDTSEESTEAPAATASGKKYAVFIAQNNNAFTMSVGEAAKARGEELGHEMTVFDGKYDQGVQINQIETAITQGYDGLIIEPCSGDGIIPVLGQAKDAGIPAVTIIQECNDQSLLASFVGADHYAASVIEAEAALEHIGGKGKVCILQGTLGTTGEIQISQAFDDVLAKYPDVEVIEKQSANFVIDEALKITETWLQKHSDIDAILAQSDAMALGAAKACTDMGIEGITVVGRDAVPEMLDALKNGSAYASIYQNGPSMGSLAVDVMDKVIAGEAVDEIYYTKNTLVTLDNIDTYKDE